MSRDYYEILEVDKNATQDEIKNAFRKKARQLHPARREGQGSDGAERQ